MKVGGDREIKRRKYHPRIDRDWKIKGDFIRFWRKTIINTTFSVEACVKSESSWFLLWFSLANCKHISLWNTCFVHFGSTIKSEYFRVEFDQFYSVLSSLLTKFLSVLLNLCASVINYWSLIFSSMFVWWSNILIHDNNSNSFFRRSDGNFFLSFGRFHQCSCCSYGIKHLWENLFLQISLMTFLIVLWAF